MQSLYDGVVNQAAASVCLVVFREERRGAASAVGAEVFSARLREAAPLLRRPVERAYGSLAVRREEAYQSLKDRPYTPSGLPLLRVVRAYAQAYLRVHLEPAVGGQEDDVGGRERVRRGEEDFPVVAPPLKVRVGRSPYREVPNANVVG